MAFQTGNGVIHLPCQRAQQKAHASLPAFSHFNPTLYGIFEVTIPSGGVCPFSNFHYVPAPYGCFFGSPKLNRVHTLLLLLHSSRKNKKLDVAAVSCTQARMEKSVSFCSTIHISLSHLHLFTSNDIVLTNYHDNPNQIHSFYHLTILSCR